MQDHVDWIQQQWRREHPELDPSPQGLIGRLARLQMRLTAEIAPVMAARGLSEGEFDVLATLRRGGVPFVMTPSEIAAQTMVTSGAVSKRLDRLETAGLVARSPSAVDGRGRAVQLTDAGFAKIEEAFTAHLANEHRLVEMLSPQERVQFAALAKKWLSELG